MLLDAAMRAVHLRASRSVMMKDMNRRLIYREMHAGLIGKRHRHVGRLL